VLVVINQEIFVLDCHDELQKIIEQEIKERTESLGTGMGVVDFVDYKLFRIHNFFY
jgi:hypothetical protein